MAALIPSRHFRRLILILVVAAVPACSSSSGVTNGDDDTTEPLGELVGTWKATSMVLTARSDPSVSVDVVQNEDVNGTFTMVFRSSGRYTAVLTAFGERDEENGTVTRSGNTLRFQPDGGVSDTVTWSLSDGVLTLDGRTTFDFNRDGTDEEATLHLEMVPA